MTDPVLNYLACPDPLRPEGRARQMAYGQWGTNTAPHVLLCVHGLTRQGRDFDVLAAHMCERARGQIRVVCPDVVGRGRSEWLADPAGYAVPCYAADMRVLIAHLQRQAPIAQLDWFGTSMGGLIGMVVAGAPAADLPVPVRRLVLNDIGPVLEVAALQRIGAYVGQTGAFDTLEQAAAAMWAVSPGFGPHTPAQWLDLCRHQVRVQQGSLCIGYDPAIAQAFRSLNQAVAAQAEATLWALYDAIQAQTLVLRGASSDLLSAATALAMTQRGPQARCVTFDGVGHAPTLVAPDQHRLVADFLLADSPLAD